MAGNRQHILPKFLLKGFASRTESGKTYTWVYPRNKMPVEANIKKVGVEKHFYGKQGELYIDDDITEFENRYSHFLDELRLCSRQTQIFDKRVPALITHLVIRTKHIRESFRESVDYLVDEMKEYFLDYNNFKEAMVSNIYKNPWMMSEAIDKEFKNHPELKPFENIIRPLLPQMYLSSFEAQKVENLEFVNSYFDKIQNDLPKLAKDGHIKALAQDLIPEPRIEEYRQLKWYLFITDKTVILGDIACLSEINGQKKYKSITINEDAIRNVFLPISDSKILIGTSHNVIPQVDVDNINEGIAKCSREFFISSYNSQHITKLVPLIGKDSEIFTKEEIKRVLTEISLNYKVGLLN